MKIEINLVLKDDDGNTINQKRAYTPNVDKRPTLEVVESIQQWVAEAAVTIQNPHNIQQ